MIYRSNYLHIYSRNSLIKYAPRNLQLQLSSRKEIYVYPRKFDPLNLCCLCFFQVTLHRLGPKLSKFYHANFKSR